MSQFDYGTIDPTTKSGSALAGDLNSFRDALHSTHKGPAAPSYAVAGLHWIDDTGDPIWLLKVFDGADWIVEAVIDTTNNVSYPVSVNPVLTYPTAGGSANALTLTPVVPMTAYANRAKVTFTAASNNSGAATLNVSGVGAKAIRTIAAGADIALVAGNLQAGRKYEVVYSSTANSGAGAWILVNLPIGTTAGTVSAGDDSRITGALQRARGQMTGDLTLKGDPTDALHAATKQYVDASGAVHSYEVFTASGTWTKPEGLPDTAVVVVELWGGGGGGSSNATNGAGGGGAYNTKRFRASELAASVPVTVGAGGTGYTTTTPGGVGGTSTFGAYLTAYGGGGGSTTGGGSGGGITSAGGSGTAGGGPGIGGNMQAGTVVPINYGGSAAASGNLGLRDSFYGGGASGGGIQGNSVYGGGSGGVDASNFGISIYGGDGGAADQAGFAPGGGGGRRASGARGECRVWIY